MYPMTPTPPPSRLKIAFEHWRSLGWLGFGVSILLVCLIMWVSLQLAKRVTVEQAWDNAPKAIDPQTQQEKLNPTLGALVDEVPLLDLTTKDIPAGVHAPEFRGVAFIDANAKKWTVQLMNVSQETVITEYLATRRDRQKFYYFRMTQDDVDRFVLTYGAFNSVQEAMRAMQGVDFALPDSIKAFPERFASYEDLVTDQGNDERIIGSVNAQKYRQVLLKPVLIPIETDPNTGVSADQSSSEPAYGALPSDQIVSPVAPRVSDGFADAPDSAPEAPDLPPVQDPFN
jgi:hypothetical protein